MINSVLVRFLNPQPAPAEITANLRNPLTGVADPLICAEAHNTAFRCDADSVAAREPLTPSQDVELMRKQLGDALKQPVIAYCGRHA